MRIAFTGCWHSNWSAAKTAIDYCAEEGITTLIQTGDFLYNKTEGRKLVQQIEIYLDLHEINLEIIGIRGNHDDPAYYRSLPLIPDRNGLAKISEHITHAPDGTILTFDNATIALLGGAHSVDHKARKEGISWWADEVPDPEAIKFLATQEFDVFVSHEAPSLIDYPRLPSQPQWWDIEGSNKIRESLGDLISQVKPRVTITGHMHISQKRTFNYPNGQSFYSVTLDHGHYGSREKTSMENLTEFLWVFDTETLNKEEA